MGTMLEVRGLWAGYTDFVVRDVSFTVAGGELISYNCGWREGTAWEYTVAGTLHGGALEG